MGAAPEPPPPGGSDTPDRPQRRTGPTARDVLTIAALFVVATAVPATQYLLKPAPPEVDFSGVEPSVERAIRRARTNVRRSPGSAELWGRLGMVLLAHDFEAAAAPCFAEAGELDPDDPSWPYLRAHCGIVSGAPPEDVVPHLERAASLSGAEPTPRLRLAEYLFEHGELDRAADLSSAVLDRDPDDARALLTRARVSLALGEPEPARDDLLRSLEAEPRARPTVELLARVHHLLGDEAAADRVLDELEGLPGTFSWPDADLRHAESYGIGESILLRRARGFAEAGERETALRVLRDAAGHHPDSARIRFQLGRLLVIMGRPAEAEEALRKALRLDPDRAAAHLFLGIALGLRDELDRSIASLRRSIELDPDDALAHRSLGYALLVSGDRPGAAESLRRALAIDPTDAEAREQLDRLLAELTGEPAVDR